MSVRYPSNIDKTRIISDIEKRYGTGETLTKTMTFFILKYLIIFAGLVILLSIIAIPIFIKMGVDPALILKFFEMGLGFLSPVIMAFAGYFIGRKADSK